MFVPGMMLPMALLGTMLGRVGGLKPGIEARASVNGSVAGRSMLRIGSTQFQERSERERLALFATRRPWRDSPPSLDTKRINELAVRCQQKKIHQLGDSQSENCENSRKVARAPNLTPKGDCLRRWGSFCPPGPSVQLGRECPRARLTVGDHSPSKFDMG